MGRRGIATLRAAAALIRDVALPPTCIACRVPVADDGGLCPACWAKLNFVSRPYCERLGTPFAVDLGAGMISPAALADPPAFQRARAVARYDEVARRLVHALKFGDRIELARPLGRMMAQAGAELLTDADAVVPVPLHWMRLWRRRFNQSAALADEIGRSAGIAARPGLLVRRRRTGHQVGLSRAERARNVQGAFAVPPEGVGEVRGRRLVLIDDVLTTGATLEACARVLSRAGAARVDALVFARVVDLADG
ncbi:competence protein F homolog [Blastochloris viridis]|uniref:Competence protein F homolog n=1 Tax=Blastochloris viridis TaxID=1079 RepID=A0A182CZV7_BLAVI|nr:ComF family protein [Blastochloris viridis]BAR98628.1 competence protein F homolog [Blastochloris viridis]